MLYLVIVLDINVLWYQVDRSLNPAISVGVAYMSALVAYRGTVNPALALGQAFVRSRFTHLWIYWLGPILGGCSAALCQVSCRIL